MSNLYSYDDEEGPDLLENLFFVGKHNLVEHSVVVDLCSQVVEEEGLSDLILELPWRGHSLHLSRARVTFSVMVAPDSTSPNL